MNIYRKNDGTISNLNWTEQNGIMNYENPEINKEPGILEMIYDEDQESGYAIDFLKQIIGITGSKDEIIKNGH